MVLNIIMITISITYIINHSGIIVDISKKLYELLNKDKIWMGKLIPKPFSCANCMNFWTVLFLTIFTYSIIQSLFIASMCSMLTPLIDNLIKLIFKIINKIQ